MSDWHTAAEVIDGSAPWAVEVCDCRDGLASLPEASVHCVVTSPPYWGLRDYGLEPTVWGGEPDCKHRWRSGPKLHRGGSGGNPQIHAVGHRQARQATDDRIAGESCGKCGAWLGSLGLEPDPYSFIEHLTEVFEAVRRVLRDDGTLWLNMGDCYANDGKWGGETGGKQSYLPDADRLRNGREKRRTGLKPKDLVGLPWMAAFALRAAGWWLRSDNIWHKPNPMPESVNDRPTKSHEYLFLLTKSARYFYDADAIREPVSCPEDNLVEDHDRAFNRRRETDVLRRQDRLRRHLPGSEQDCLAKGIVMPAKCNNASGRNKRTVWTIQTFPFPGAHFATFPPDLVAPCILAGTSEIGCCPHCGAGRVRKTKVIYQNPGNNQPVDLRLEKQTVMVGWRKGCECDYRAAEAVPAIVLDPFSGAGTTGVVARLFGRRFIGFEASAAYAAQSRGRIAQRGARPESSVRPLAGQRGLFE